MELLTTLFTNDKKSLEPGRREAAEGGLNDRRWVCFYTAKCLHLKPPSPTLGWPGAEVMKQGLA